MDTFSKSDPFIVLFQEGKGGQWVETHRTETIMDNLNPEFSKTITLDYRFETQQKLKFEVYDEDSKTTNLSKHDFIGKVNTTLGEIVGASSGRFERSLRRAKI